MAAAVSFSSCQHKNAAPERISIVKLCEVAQYGDERTVSFPGKVKAAAEVNLAFRISGPIAKINVQEGQFVRKGAVLAEMDARDYAIQFSATEAEYKQIKAEAERIIDLYEKESVPANDYDKAVYGLQQISAKYQAHKNALEDTKLTAPFDGYIQKRYFDRDETISAGMPVFSIISVGMPEVEINIPASEFIRRDRFDAFSCRFDIYPDRVFPLELIAVNQKANMNQLYTVRLKMTGGADAPSPTPGMSTMVEILLKQETGELTTIPISALFERDGVSSVWVYDENNGAVHARAIVLSEILSEGTLVVSEGLKTGEKVVAAGVHTLSDGEKVRLLPETTKSNAGGLL